MLFRLRVPDSRLEAALLGHGRNDVGRGVRVDVIAMLSEVGVAQHKFFHGKARTHLKQHLETAKKCVFSGQNLISQNLANLVDDAEDLFQQKEALPILAPGPADLHRDVGRALHLSNITTMIIDILLIF